MVTSQRQNDNC